MIKVETRDDLLDILPKNSIGAELGVFKGQFSETILRVVKPSMLYLVDKFPKRARSGDKDGKNIEQVNLLEYYESVLLPKYRDADNVTLIKGSTDLLSSLDDDHLDWCYIDADHSFGGVTKDINLMKLKVKKGGWITGHDFTPRTIGVLRAVEKFCDDNNLEIKYLTKDRCPSFAIQL